MYFLGFGTIAFVSDSNQEMYHLEDGDHFGEICLFLHDRKRKATAVALEFSEVYRLDRRDYNQTIRKNLELNQTVETTAMLRLQIFIKDAYQNRSLNISD